MIVVRGRDRVAAALSFLLGAALLASGVWVLHRQPLPSFAPDQDPTDAARSTEPSPTLLYVIASVFGLPGCAALLGAVPLARRGAWLRITADGLAFPIIPNGRLARRVSWADVQALHCPSATALLPGVRQYAFLLLEKCEDSLLLGIETIRPRSEAVRLGSQRVLSQVSAAEQSELFPAEVRQRLHFERIRPVDVTPGALFEMLNRLLAEPHLREKYGGSPLVYRIREDAQDRPELVLSDEA